MKTYVVGDQHAADLSYTNIVGDTVEVEREADTVSQKGVYYHVNVVRRLPHKKGLGLRGPWAVHREDLLPTETTNQGAVSLLSDRRE